MSQSSASTSSDDDDKGPKHNMLVCWYRFKGSPETLVFVFGVCTSFNGTSTAHFLAIFWGCFSTPFSDSAHLGVQRLFWIRQPVAWQRPSRVHHCLPHNRGDDMPGWFGYHRSRTHWNIIHSTFYYFEGFFSLRLVSLSYNIINIIATESTTHPP